LDPLSTSVTRTRQARRRLETADRIAEAAGALFAERGVVATTVTDICERADVARQTFFNHFGSKQDLVEAIAGAKAARPATGSIGSSRRSTGPRAGSARCTRIS
jgi:AcrR family transcriptional regulator